MGRIEFRILKNVRCIHWKGTGELTFDYLMSRIMDLHRDPDFDLSFNTFVDYEDATLSVRSGGLDRYKSFFKELQQAGIHRKWAIYSRRHKTRTSANMSHLLLSAEIEVDVFEVREQALRFLGITEADLADI